MNKRQTVALWVGIAVMVAMFLYPPWERTAAVGGNAFSNNPPSPVAITFAFGYAFLFDKPDGNVTVNFRRLGAQWFLVAVITGAAIVTLKDR